MNNLLARFAENGFWMARYMERTENLARILDVNESFARDKLGEQEWLPIVNLHADEEAFFKRYPEATADAVIEFYTIDRENPNSIVQMVWAARENARSLRHLISIEMWTQLNVFYKYVSELDSRNLRLADLSHLCQDIKEGCQLHTGIVEGTTFRDQGWVFYELGKMIDRADQTTRLLDIKYHRLLPNVADVGSPLDVSQWNALLRSVAGYHGYRRECPSGMSPESVAGFILMNPAFTRSVACCVHRIRAFISRLESNPELAAMNLDIQPIIAIEAQLNMPIRQAIGEGLHEYLDRIQINLQKFADNISATFFGTESAADDDVKL